jgi:hypothetical protein
MAKTKKKPKYEKVEPTLNAEQAAFVAKLNKLEDAMKKAKDAYYEASRRCVHAIGYTIDWSWGPECPEGDTYCTICGHHFGHYCPESPDHTCHYFTDDGKIELVTGEKVDPPTNSDGSPHDPDYETDDCCVFCGAPDERK